MSVLKARGQSGWQKEILVWFIPSSIANEGDFPKVIKYLRSKGVVVITTTEANSVLATINEAYKSWHGTSLLDRWADWAADWLRKVGKFKEAAALSDPQVRASLERKLYDGSIFNFIPPEEVGLTRRQRSLAEFEKALMGFAEDAEQAVKLRDFVRKNWGLLAPVAGVTLKVVFDIYNRLNPPKTPRAQETVDMNADEPIEFENVLLPRLAEKAKLQAFIVPRDAWLPVNTLKELEEATKTLKTCSS
ncbi:MAG: hypothetical protein LM580_09385 [Thermofilum sp.]|nr:hypothetical protein [Thermofilum sp.]